MKFRSVLMRICVIAWSLAAARAEAADLFGPRTYVVAAGQPQELREVLRVAPSARCDGRATFVMIIENGGEEPTTRVSSAVVAVNGAPVARESDFQSGVPRMERPVTLGDVNELAVRLNGGRPGAFVRVTIRSNVEDDAVAPETLSLAGGQLEATRHFSVSAPWSQYVLAVTNGDSSGGRRISSGSISVNGVELVGERDLNRQTHLLRVPLPLLGENTLDVVARGDGGSVLTVAVRRLYDAAACVLRVDIASPLHGSTVAAAPIPVRGTVIGPRDVGVTVNGAAAAVDFNHAGSTEDPFPWFAEISGTPGTVDVVAEAALRDGFRRRVTRSVTYVQPDEIVMLSPSSRYGVAPFNVLFDVRVNASSPPARYELDFDGNGAFEWSYAAEDLPDDIGFTYDAPGVYQPVVRAQLEDGRTLTSDSVLVAQPFAILDEVVRKVWSRFRETVAAGNIERALVDVAPNTREKYRDSLTLIRSNLGRYAASLSDIRTASITGDVAHYLIVRQEDGRPHGYHLYLVRCADGLWRIAQF